LDEEIQKLVKKLGEAINDSINESSSVNEALEELRQAGHDAFLVLEATIAFKDKPAEANAPDASLNQLSKEDEQFLRSLNIRFDTEE
jgi:hypothetical protein